MLSGNLHTLDINQALEKIQPHDHLCLICRSLAECSDVVGEYIKIGIERGEKCICLLNKSNKLEILSYLTQNGVDVKNVEKIGQLEIIENNLRFEPKYFCAEKRINWLKKKIEKALSEGYLVIRMSDDMNWATNFNTEPDKITGYEARLNQELFLHYPCIMLCQYEKKKFNARTLRKVLIGHPFFIRQNKIYINTYYIPPEIYLSDERDEYQLEEWFNNVERERLYGDRMGFFADILRRSTQPFVAMSQDRSIITCNPAFCELSGYTLDELRQMTWNWGLSKDENYKYIGDVCLNEARCSEKTYISKDGKCIPVEEFTHQVCSNDGEIKYYYAFVNDISERKKNEENLRESEARYRTLFNSMHEGFALCEFVTDENGEPRDFRFLEINHAFETLFVLEKNRLIGRMAKEVLPELYNYSFGQYGDLIFRESPLICEYYSSTLKKHFEVIAFNIKEERFAIIFFDISKQKVLERELQEQLHFLQNLIDSIPTPAFYRDMDGRFQFCNEAFRNALGLSSAAIIGHSLYNVLPKDLADKYREMDLTLLSTSGVQCYDWEFQYADGNRHDVIFNKAPLANSKGEQNGVVGTMIDITQRKKAQEALRKSEERCKKIFSQSPIGIALYNFEGILIEMNGVCKNIFGLINTIDRQGGSLNLLNDIIDPEDKKNLLNGDILNFVRKMDYDLIKKNGMFYTCKSGISYVNIFISPLISEQGRPDGFLVHVQDISEKKKAEDALKSNEAQLRRITENMMDMISQISINGTFEYVSPSQKSILGYKYEQILKHSFFDFIHPDDKNRVKHIFNVSFRRRLFSKFDYRCKRADGEYKILETVGNILYDDNGDITGAVFGTRDITERRQMEKEIARLDRLRAIGEMAASIGHEIRNPMTTVRGFLQVLGDKEGCMEYKEYFDLMIEEMDSANSIVAEFLTLARDKAVYPTMQNLNLIVKAIFPLAAADAKKFDKQIILELQDIPDLLVDAKEMRQLILNLTRNGLEAMGSGGKLHIRTYRHENEVILSVEDEGKGIEPEVLDKIGTPFFTTKEQGTGLGMAICYSIAERHNAIININTGKKGSAFSVHFNCDQEIEKENNEENVYSVR